jgi:hypothetical protein
VYRTFKWPQRIRYFAFVRCAFKRIWCVSMIKADSVLICYHCSQMFVLHHIFKSLQITCASKFITLYSFYTETTIFTGMQDKPILRLPLKIKMLSKKHFTVNFRHLIHKACQILHTFTNQCHCDHLHSQCLHLPHTHF